MGERTVVTGLAVVTARIKRTKITEHDDRCIVTIDQDRQTALDLADLIERWPIGYRCSVAHDGFDGTVQGYYVTREGKPGLVLQQKGTRVVHVYGEKWFKDQEPE